MLSGIGFLVFLSTFFAVASNSQRRPVDIQVFPAGEQHSAERYRDLIGIPRETVYSAPPEPSQIFARALTGMGLMALGGILMSIGAQGLAGSGIILDPDKAREDLKPWSHMAGGMLDDALSQSQRAAKVIGVQSEEVVKVRCSSCRTLNDESAKFCDECGSKL